MTSPVRALWLPRQSSAPPVPGLLRGCGHERSRDATPDILRIRRCRAAVLPEMPQPIYDEIPASRWPGSPGSCYEWPAARFHIYPAGGASRCTVFSRVSTAFTGVGSTRISATYSRPAGKPALPLSVLHPQLRYECQYAVGLAWGARP